MIKHFKTFKLENFSQEVIQVLELANLSGIAVRHRKCPYIELKNSWDDQNEILSKKLVRNLRQYGNKAEREGITMQVYFGAELNAEERLEKIKKSYAYHDLRMQDKNQDSKFTHDAFRLYNEEVMKLAENTFIIEASNKEK